MTNYETTKQAHEQEYTKLVRDLYLVNNQRDVILKRINEVEFILATINHLKPNDVINPPPEG